MPVKRDDVIKLAQQLVKENTTNPPGNEKRVADILSARLKKLGFEITTFEAAAARPNIIATWKGKKPGKTLIFHDHMDTVPTGPADQWKHDPFSAKVVDGKLYGRGSTDPKSGLASMLSAIEALKRDKWEPCGTLMFMATSNEEMGDLDKIGLRFAIQKIPKADLVVMCEATNHNIVLAEKGVLWLEFTAKGKEAHGSMPWLGVNAIEMLGKFLIELRKVQFPAEHKLLGKSTISINTFDGGYKTNVVPPHAHATVDFRLVPGEKKEVVLKLVNDLISSMKVKDNKVDISIHEVLWAEPVEVRSDMPAVSMMVDSVKSATGKKPEVIGEHGSTMAGVFIKAGTPAIVYGPGEPGMCHVRDETIAIDDMVEAAQVYAEFAKRFLK